MRCILQDNVPYEFFVEIFSHLSSLVARHLKINLWEIWFVFSALIFLVFTETCNTFCNEQNPVMYSKIIVIKASSWKGTVLQSPIFRYIREARAKNYFSDLRMTEIIWSVFYLELFLLKNNTFIFTKEAFNNVIKQANTS